MKTDATIYPNAKRGSDTFQQIETFPFDEHRRGGRAVADNVVEVAVLDGLPDITDFVVEGREGATVVDFRLRGLKLASVESRDA